MALSSRGRRIIVDYFGDLKEEVKWKAPTYSKKKNVCSKIANKGYVNFQIMQGAHIYDAQELEGTGEGIRHMKFSALEEIDIEKVDDYLHRAVDLDNDFKKRERIFNPWALVKRRIFI